MLESRGPAIEPESPLDDSPATPSSAPAAAGELIGAEHDLWAATIAGDVAQPRDLGTPFEDQSIRVRADFVRYLATERDSSHKVHERGVRLHHLRVVGTLDLTGCEIRRPLRFEDCLLDDVRVTGAKLATLSFVGGSVGTIEGDRCIAAALFLRGVTVRGGARFLGAQIAGDLDCDAAKLVAQQPGAGAGNSNVSGGDVALGLDGAAIGGAMFLRRTTLDGSLMASSVTVGKVFDARNLVVRTGQVVLHTAIVGGDVDFGGAAIVDVPGHPRSPCDNALVLTQARVGGTVRLTGRFQTDRGVMLNDLRVAGNLSLRGARFVAERAVAVSAQRMQVDGTFDLDSNTCFGLAAAVAADAGKQGAAGRLGPRRRGADEPPREPGSALDLTAASVGSLSDQWADWPRGNRVLGFRYKAIVGATSTRADWWVRWLKLQVDEDLRVLADDAVVVGVDGFKPQPWDQAILALRAAGCTRDAEDVAIAKETAEFAHSKNPLHFLHVLWGICAGYGYRPLRLLWALPVVYFFSVWIYAEAADRGVMAPTSEELLAKAEYRHCQPEHGGNWARCALAPAYPDFSAWAYAMQMLLPAIELRQAKDWAPVEWRRPVVALAPAGTASVEASAASATTASAAVPDDELRPPSTDWGRCALYWSWVETTLGLVAPVLVGLALTGLIRRKLKD